MFHKHDVGFINKLNGKQERFGLRKYAVGLCSVLLGTAFFMVNGNTVHAETTNAKESPALTQKTKMRGEANLQPSRDAIQDTASSDNAVAEKQTTTDAIINLEKQKSNDVGVSCTNLPAKDNTDTSQTETQTVVRDVYTKLPRQEPELLATQSETTSHSRFLIKVVSGYEHYNDNNLSRLQEVDGQSVSQYRNQITNYQYEKDDPNFVTYTPWINKDGDHTVVDINKNPNLDGTDNKWYENTIYDMSVWGNWTNWTPVTFDKVQAPDKKGYQVINPTAGDKMTFINGDVVTNPHMVVTYQYQPKKTQDTENRTFKRTIYTQLPGEKAVEYKQQTADSSRTRAWIEVQSGYENQDEIYPNVGKDMIYMPKTGRSWLGRPDGYQTFTAGYVFYSRNRITNYAYPESSPKHITYTKWYDLNRPRTLGFQNEDKSGNPVPIQSGWGEYGNWTGGKFAAIKAPEIAGYTVANPDVAPEVTDANKDLTATFVYTANDQTRKIIFIDPENKSVGNPQTLTGKTGTSVTIGNGEGQTPLEVPTGYEIVPNTQVPSSVGFNATDNPDITVKVQAKVDTDDGCNDKSNSDVYRQVTETVTVNIEGQEPQVRTQTLDFYRIKSTNEATGQVTYTDWTSNMTDKSTSFAPVEIPTAGGYTRTITGGTITTKDGKDYVASVSGLSDGTPVNNINVTVNYTKAEQTATIQYVDNNDHNHVVGTQEVSGKIGETVKVTYTAPTNWKIVAGQPTGETITFGSTPIKDTIVYVEHKTEDVTNDPSLRLRVNKTITRTIKIDVAGKVTTLSPAQTVTLHRTATKDLVTKEITYSLWNTAKFAAVTAPKEPGYTVTNPDAAPAMTVTSETKDSPVIFVYTPNAQTVKIIFVDPNGKTVGNQTLTGKTGTSVTIGNGAGETPLNIPSGYKLVPGVKDVPTKVPFNPTNNPDITIQVEKVVPQPQKDKYTPIPKDIHTRVGKEPTPAQGIANIPNLPTGTTYTWTNGAPDVSTPGTKSVEITVHYPGGTTATVTTKVIVEDSTKKPEDKYTPIPKDIHTRVGKEPTPAQGIGNIPNLPTGTTYTWTNGAPDVTTPGTKSTEITVHYPDGSTDTVTTKVIVEEPAKNPTDADKYTPEGQDINVEKGAKVPDASTVIINKPELPAGTKYEWKNTPSTDKVGNVPAVVVVTYPDGSVDEVPTTVHVTDNTPAPTQTDTDKNTPEPKDIHTQVGVVPSPEQGIGNVPSLPSGSTYTWTNGQPDVTTPGTKSVTITVHYPDGTTATVTTKVIVDEPTQNPTSGDEGNQPTPTPTPQPTKSTVTPQPQPVVIPAGQVPDPEQGIKNKDEFPTGTKFTWKDTPDVSQPGKITGTVIVTYPTGETTEVPVEITVAPHANVDTDTAGQDEDTTNVEDYTSIRVDKFDDDNPSNKLEAGANVHASLNTTDKAKTLPQTGAQTTKTGLLGLAIASVGAILGLAVNKKRKN
ncbi:Rib/alpha-like domain-containing protein [Lactobacillus sp. PV034]|uniref:Rib/alpha-like domain-containing protein n=1 Tax=Lactobacillus sp. PV034 TaxID=2594495 RepID=UPI00223EE33C|nr:Rib/alpha-like domain-containing protein [Lactobacillus sp. PV034]QNQ80220.1 YSIRK-type signal peptide-containing protein [Lactobacillus sp. PV034]